MSTRSHIGIKNEDGTVTSIYCHFDGYPQHHGPILVGHYSTEEKVRTLIALGDLSQLGEEIGTPHPFDECPKGTCNFYGRDRGEQGTEAILHTSKRNFLRAYDEDFAYLFLSDEGEWYYCERSGNLRPMKSDVERGRYSTDETEE